MAKPLLMKNCCSTAVNLNTKLLSSKINRSDLLELALAVGTLESQVLMSVKLLLSTYQHICELSLSWSGFHTSFPSSCCHGLLLLRGRCHCRSLDRTSSFTLCIFCLTLKACKYTDKLPFWHACLELLLDPVSLACPSSAPSFLALASSSSQRFRVLSKQEERVRKEK